MKETILKVLLENTELEERYTGGGYEPKLIVFKNSEDQDKEQYLRKIAAKITAEMRIKK